MILAPGLIESDLSARLACAQCVKCGSWCIENEGGMIASYRRLCGPCWRDYESHHNGNIPTCKCDTLAPACGKFDTGVHSIRSKTKWANLKEGGRKSEFVNPWWLKTCMTCGHDKKCGH